MRSVNRSTLIIRPKEPYAQWARSVDDEAATITIAELRRESTVYLIPEVTDDSHAEELIRDCFAVIFENELNGWIVDETAWPAHRTYEMFRRWFDVEVDSVVVDLCDYRFEVEDL